MNTRALAGISGNAAKLYLYLMLAGAESPTVAELLRFFGWKSRTTFYRARDELRRAGFVESVHNSAPSVHTMCTPVHNSALGVHNSAPPVHNNASSVHNSAPPVESQAIKGYTTPLEEACEIDAMDASGAWGNRTSPANKRRRVQAEFVKRIWGDMYPDNDAIADATARRLISLCQDSAEEVYLLFQEFEGRGKPISYVMKVASNRAQERKSQAAQPSISPAPTQADKEPELEPMTEEYKQYLQDLATDLKERGVWTDDDE